MPRKARIDYPGALHHIIVRGIERRNIFRDQIDYTAFLNKLELVLTKTQTPCYAWALMPNHFHLLLQSGNKSISKVMHSLLTRYAIYFNKRHNRCGRFYQNRFKSILCDYDEYLLELVRYIHLNPIRSGIIKNIQVLDYYPWTGHKTFIGNDKQKQEWQQTENILQMFGKTLKYALKNYRQFIIEGIENSNKSNLNGGGLIRSTGGIWEVIKAKQQGNFLRGDERILGDSSFVEKALKSTDEIESNQSILIRQGKNFKYFLKKIAKLYNIPASQICSKNKNRTVAEARALICTLLSDKIGMTR